MKRTPALFNGKDLVSDLECIYDECTCVTSKTGWQLGFINDEPVQTYIFKNDNKVNVLFPFNSSATERQGKLNSIIRSLYEIYEEKVLSIDYEWANEYGMAILFFYFVESKWEKIINEMTDNEFNELSKVVYKRMLSV